MLKTREAWSDLIFERTGVCVLRVGLWLGLVMMLFLGSAKPMRHLLLVAAAAVGADSVGFAGFSGCGSSLNARALATLAQALS